jgi:DNA-binding IclR family transcriptional regulator
MSSAEWYSDGDRIAAASGDTVVRRALSLLTAFSPRHQRLTLSSLVVRTGLPKTTVHRLAQELTQLGMLARDGNSYTIGQRIVEIAGLAPVRRELREAALPFMQDLFEATHETIHLGVLSGMHILYVEKINGHRRTTELSQYGGHMPLYCTSLGKAILSRSSPELVEEVITNGLLPYTTSTITSPQLLRHELREAATRGLAYDREEAAVGVCCVGAPIMGPNGEVVAAISVTGAASRMRLDRLGTAVRAAAVGAAREMRRA